MALKDPPLKIDPQNQFQAFPSQRLEAQRYAALLRFGVRLALLTLPLAFLVYAIELPPPHVPIHELPRYWSLPSAEYVRQAGMPRGWDWAARLAQGDVLTILPAVLLCSLSVACLLAIWPMYFRKRDWPFVLIVFLLLAVLLISALPAAGP